MVGKTRIAWRRTGFCFYYSNGLWNVSGPATVAFGPLHDKSRRVGLYLGGGYGARASALSEKLQCGRYSMESGAAFDSCQCGATISRKTLEGTTKASNSSVKVMDLKLHLQRFGYISVRRTGTMCCVLPADPTCHEFPAGHCEATELHAAGPAGTVACRAGRLFCRFPSLFLTKWLCEGL